MAANETNNEINNETNHRDCTPAQNANAADAARRGDEQLSGNSGNSGSSGNSSRPKKKRSDNQSETASMAIGEDR